MIVTKNIKDASQLRAKLPDVLCDLENCLGSRIDVKWKLTFEKKTPFSLQFNMSRYSNPKDTFKVDLLPTFEANVEGNNGMYLLKHKGCNIAFMGSDTRRLTSWTSRNFVSPKFLK